jgi:hypothetical protein
MAQTLKAALLNNLESLKKLSSTDRLKMRYQKYRAYGQFLEKKEKTPGVETPQPAGNGAVPAPPA